MRYRRMLVLACVSTVMGIGAIPLWALGSTPTWKPRETIAAGVIDRDGHKAADRILAYDHYGNPGVVFCTDDCQLWYGRKPPGAGWVSTRVETMGTHDVRYPSLAYDRFEYPLISVQDYQGGSPPMAYLNYVDWDRSTNMWMMSNPDAASPSGDYTCIAVDLYGLAGISYGAEVMEGGMMAAEPALRFGHDCGTMMIMIAETVEFGQVQATSLAFDRQNRPMIAYHLDNGIRFAVKEPIVGWARAQVVQGTLPADSGPSLALGPATGYPAIAYADADSKLAFAEWDGTQWTTTIVDDGAAAYPSLAYDPGDNNPGIAYASLGDLKFAWHDGSSWHTMVVDNDPIELGFHPSLAFNEYGTGWPAIAYTSWDTLFFIEDPPEAVAVPEPGTIALLLTGAGSLAATGRRRRRRG